MHEVGTLETIYAIPSRAWPEIGASSVESITWPSGVVTSRSKASTGGKIKLTPGATPKETSISVGFVITSGRENWVGTVPCPSVHVRCARESP